MATKAKLKRYKDGAWEEYYPTTSAEQVTGLEQLINSLIDENTIELTATLPAADWSSSGSGGLEQTVEVPGILEIDNPVIDLTFSGEYLADTNQFYEWAKVYRITTQDNAIKAFAVEAPATDINIKILVIRK